MIIPPSLALACALAAPTRSSECPIRPILKTITSLEKLVATHPLRFEQSGEGDCNLGHVELSKDELSFTCDSGNTVMRHLECSGPAIFSGATATATCKVPSNCRARVTVDGDGPRDCTGDEDDRTVTLAVEVRAASPEILRGGATWSFAAAAQHPSPAFLLRGPKGVYAKTYDASGPARSIELFAGAADRAIFTAVKHALQRPGPSGCPLLFEAPPAREPRATSEIFVSPEAGDASLYAQRLAQRIEPITGPLPINPWPSTGWDYDIVVVAGAAAAPAFVSNDCPSGMARVPAGRVASSGKQVPVGPFCMDLTEVTAAAYGQCAHEGKCRTDNVRSEASQFDRATSNGPFTFGKSELATHPMNCVDFADAAAYCAAVGKRLPTYYEWRWAASSAQGTPYPWGDATPDDTVTCWSGGSRRSSTCPVGSFWDGGSLQRIQDLTGNVWEWTTTTSDEAYPHHASIDGLQPNTPRVQCGGAWTSLSKNELRNDWCRGSPPANRDYDVGFRCVSDARP